MRAATTSTTKLSVNQFIDRLRDEVQRVAKEKDWNIDVPQQRGMAFQLWVARVIAEYEGGYETDPEDAMLTSNDLKADLVFEDTTRNHLLICQCKYEGLGKKKPVDESSVNDFFNRHAKYLDRAWVSKHGSKDAQDALLDYGEKIDAGYKVTYYYVTTGEATDRVHQLVTNVNSEFAKRGEPVTCVLYDVTAWKDYYVRSESMDGSGPAEVEIQLHADSWFEKSEPHPTIVATLGGNALRDLYKRYKESLFNWNIRGYLGNRGINSDIADTAENRGADFFYFNNGVSAICTDYEVKGDLLTARGFQVINGAQTIGALARAPSSSEVEVLFRLTKSLNVKSEKGFNREIIKYNNTQNVIKISDFRSNDPIQRWLQKELPERRPKGPLPQLRYIPKRSGERDSGQIIRLEELAKIRYSFLLEPTLAHSDPRALWTHEEDGGAYEKAFGIDGQLPELWPPTVLEQCLLAIAFYLRVERVTKDLAKKTPSLKFMRRLRFHAEALCGLAFRKATPERVRALLQDEKEFDKEWSSLWPSISEIISDAHVELEGMTMFAFVRSPLKWQKMEQKLLRRLELRAAQ